MQAGAFIFLSPQWKWCHYALLCELICQYICWPDQAPSQAFLTMLVTSALTHYPQHWCETVGKSGYGEPGGSPECREPTSWGAESPTGSVQEADEGEGGVSAGHWWGSWEDQVREKQQEDQCIAPSQGRLAPVEERVCGHTCNAICFPPYNQFLFSSTCMYVHVTFFC